MRPAKAIKTTDLPNFIDPAELGDMEIYEKLKFEFPFYRINIEQFDHNLSQIDQNELLSTNFDTSFVTIEQLKTALCVTPAWRELWPNVAALLQTSAFKELVVTDTIRDTGH